MVMKVLQATDAHPTADWVYQEVRKRIPNISLGTVYRNLNQLVDSGELVRIEDKFSVRFDANLEDHDHFHCNRCDRWYDIPLQGDRLLGNLELDPGYVVKRAKLELNGICPDCQT